MRIADGPLLHVSQRGRNLTANICRFDALTSGSPDPIDLKIPDVNAQKEELEHLVRLMKSHGVPAVSGNSEKIDL